MRLLNYVIVSKGVSAGAHDPPVSISKDILASHPFKDSTVSDDSSRSSSSTSTGFRSGKGSDTKADTTHRVANNDRTGENSYDDLSSSSPPRELKTKDGKNEKIPNKNDKVTKGVWESIHSDAALEKALQKRGYNGLLKENVNVLANPHVATGLADDTTEGDKQPATSISIPNPVQGLPDQKIDIDVEVRTQRTFIEHVDTAVVQKPPTKEDIEAALAAQRMKEQEWREDHPEEAKKADREAKKAAKAKAETDKSKNSVENDELKGGKKSVTDTKSGTGATGKHRVTVEYDSNRIQKMAAPMMKQMCFAGSELPQCKRKFENMKKMVMNSNGELVPPKALKRDDQTREKFDVDISDGETSPSDTDKSSSIRKLHKGKEVATAMMNGVGKANSGRRTKNLERLRGPAPPTVDKRPKAVKDEPLIPLRRLNFFAQGDFDHMNPIHDGSALKSAEDLEKEKAWKGRWLGDDEEWLEKRDIYQSKITRAVRQIKAEDKYEEESARKIQERLNRGLSTKVMDNKTKEQASSNQDFSKLKPLEPKDRIGDSFSASQNGPAKESSAISPSIETPEQFPSPFPIRARELKLMTEESERELQQKVVATTPVTGMTIVGGYQSLMGREAYARFDAGTRVAATPVGQNNTIVNNKTLILPFQPGDYQLTTKAHPLPFEVLDQNCKNQITNYVIYEGLSFGNDGLTDCRSHIQNNPFELNIPSHCTENVCNLWVRLLSDVTKTAGFSGQPPTGDVAPCRLYMCYIAQFFAQYSTDGHCGPRLLRDAYTYCDWSFRGCSAWAGKNSRLPAEMGKGANEEFELLYPQRTQFLPYTNRHDFNQLNNGGEQEQFMALGWVEQKWAQRRFTIPRTEDNLNIYQKDLRVSVVRGKDKGYVHLPESEFKCFDQLAEAEQDAVRYLHQTIDGWHLCADISGLRDHCTWPQEMSMRGVYPRSHPLYDCMAWRTYVEEPLRLFYGHMPWAGMTKLKKDVYGALGYTEQTWNGRKIPDTFLKEWKDLNTNELGAAKFLHFSEPIWNGCPETACIEKKHYAERLSIPTRAFPGRPLDWNSLADFQKSEFETIGWKPETWDDGGPLPATMLRQWDELTQNVQNIVRKYGWDSASWAGCVNTPCLDRYNYIQAKYWTSPWVDFSPRVKRKLEELGWTANMWNKYGTTNEVPNTFRKQWRDLTHDEKLAAQFIDYDEFTWNGCAGADQATTAPPPPPSTEDPFRRIRAELYMPRSYNEIMSVEPTVVASTPLPGGASTTTTTTTSTLPTGTTIAPPTSTGAEQTGFSLVAKQAIGRALFCNNPEYNGQLNPDQVDPSGLPLCIDRDPYDDQKDRISILSINHGIKMEFEIAANRTAKEMSAVLLYNRLLEKTNNPQSDFRHDRDFTRFSNVAQLSMLEFSEADYSLEMKNRAFEDLRKQYDSKNACTLYEDTKHGIVLCPKEHAVRSGISVVLFTIFIFWYFS